MSYYGLDGQPISQDEWMRALGDMPARTIGRDERDGVTVSTVWLGLDHGFGQGPPLIFETMVFGGNHDEEQWRYSTREQAEIGHKEACALAFGGEQ